MSKLSDQLALATIKADHAYCPACGHAVDPGARFCANCAAPLTARTEPERLP